MKDQIIEKLEKIVKELTDQDIKIELTRPSDENHGDYSTNIALRLAKVLSKSPMEIAKQIAEKLSMLNDQLSIEKVEAVAPGFINFFLSKDALLAQASEVLHSPEKAGKNEKMKGKKVIIEFTDPNPFKEFHIGHVYTNTIGEALSRLHEAVGAEVHRADYFGDVGMHVAKALWGLKKMLTEDGLKFGDLANKTLEERISYFGKAYAFGSATNEENDKEEIKKLNKIIYIAAQKMWQKEKGLEPKVDYRKGEEIDENELERVYEWYSTGRKWSLEYFETIYARLGMKFAGYYPESIAGEKGYKLVKDHVKDGIFVEDQGAIIFPGTDHGLHTRVFINSLGLPTYEAKELGLAVWKSEEFPYDFSIIITGNEINEYFKVLMKALSILRPDLASKSLHIGHGMVKLSSGKKMSSRTGQIIAGKDVLDEGKKLAKEKIVEAKIGKESVDEESSDEVAEEVGIGAIKYSFLKSGIGKDIPFSFEESVSFEGNSGPYVQYSYTRTQSVLEKAGIAPPLAHNDGYSLDYPSDYTANEDELRILRQIQKFSEIVEEAALNYSPNLVTEYLFSLCQNFNNFYQKYRILNASTEQEKKFRLALTATVGVVIHQGLYLLGIKSPEKM